MRSAINFKARTTAKKLEGWICWLVFIGSLFQEV